MPAKKTVAIVGAHTKTRDAAPWSRKYVDIWVFNESISIGWAKRADAVFQMHHEAIWRNPLNRNDGNYHSWMLQEHPYPIYMLDKYTDVPAAEKYPLDEVAEYCLSGLLRGRNKKEKIGKYFTSSVNYAIALAIYQKYESIELYGIEMESNTEYSEQRPGVFFWIGLALGRGIEVIVHEQSGFFRDLLYGYEGGHTLTSADFKKRIEMFNTRIPGVETALQQVGKGLEILLRQLADPELVSEGDAQKYFQLVRQQAELLIEHAALTAGKNEAERYLQKSAVMDHVGGQHIFSRQEFEITAAGAHNMENQRRAAMSTAGGSAVAFWRNMQAAILEDPAAAEKVADEYFRAHNDYLQKAMEYGQAVGIVKENLEYMALHDRLAYAAGGEKSVEAMTLAAQENMTDHAIEAAVRLREETENESMVA